MPKYKKGDIINGNQLVTKVVKVPKSQRMSIKNPFGLMMPYRVHYKITKGPFKGETGSFGSD